MFFLRFLNLFASSHTFSLGKKILEVLKPNIPMEKKKIKNKITIVRIFPQLLETNQCFTKINIDSVSKGWSTTIFEKVEISNFEIFGSFFFFLEGKERMNFSARTIRVSRDLCLYFIFFLLVCAQTREHQVSKYLIILSVAFELWREN